MKISVLLIILLSRTDFSQGSVKGCGRLEESPESSPTTEFPWLVSIHNKLSKEFICNGHLISKRHVVTSTACLFEGLEDVSSALIYVVAGRRSLKTKTKTEQTKNVKYVNRINVLKDLIFEDTAILVLESPVVFSKTIKPICVLGGPKSTCLDSESCPGKLVSLREASIIQIFMNIFTGRLAFKRRSRHSKAGRIQRHEGTKFIDRGLRFRKKMHGRR